MCLPFASLRYHQCRCCRNYLGACSLTTKEKNDVKETNKDETKRAEYIAKVQIYEAKFDEGRVNPHGIVRLQAVAHEEGITVEGDELLGIFWHDALYEEYRDGSCTS